MRDILGRAQKFMRVIRRPEYWSALRRGVAAAVEHEGLPIAPDLRTIIDVGASRGQFSLVARRLFPRAQLTCFEPLAEARATAERLLPEATIHGVALGAHDGPAALHVAGRDDSSSLLPIGRGQVHSFAGTHQVGERTVDVRRLDSFRGTVQRPSLLKIDVQGGELDVLRGARDTLPLLDWVYLECSFTELYDGQPLAGAVIRYLEERDLCLVGVYNVTRVDGRCIQADCLFRRTVT